MDKILLENRFLGDPAADMCVAAKYYFAEGYKQRDVRKRVVELLLRCDPGANPVLLGKTIDRQVKRASRRRLVEIDYIPITKSEFDRIGALPNRTLKKMAFSYLCAAKYFNRVNDRNNGWANLSIKDICSMGNVAIPVDKQYALRGALAKMGYLQLSVVVDNINARVLFVDDGSDEVMRVTEMRDLGNQYFQRCGEPYIKCDLCGALVRKRGRRMVYCSNCSRKADYKKRTERYRNKR